MSGGKQRREEGNVMDFDVSRFRETFFQEAAEHLETMEAALLSLQSAQPDDETLNSIFRCAHSIKAGAGMFGFDELARFTHTMESLLDQMRNGEVGVSPPLLELLLRSVDMLRALADSAARGDAPSAGWEAVIVELGRAGGTCLSVPPTPVPTAAARPLEIDYQIGFQPAAEIFSSGLDPFLVLRDLSQLGEIVVEADVSALPELEQVDPETCYLGWRIRLKTSAAMDEIHDVFAFVEDLAVISIDSVGQPVPQSAVSAAAGAIPAQTSTRLPVQPGRRPAARESSIRVATEKVDRLIDLVGELVIAQSMATQLMNGFTMDRLQSLQHSLMDMELHTRELQDRAMRIRMMPIGNIFSRFPRLVHDTAQALGKQVALHISGEETEIDKGVIELIADPLTHLVRNAVDHGIEQPEARLKAGKPAEGTLSLTAYHRGGNVIVEVSDDGSGLDTARIRSKGIERGLMSPDEDLSDEQIHALIFQPGFSTSDVVSDISGRGVGMDVVKRSVEALKGAVAIESQRGRGSTLRIRLPLTLAILDGLLLRIGEQIYVMPLVSVIESIRPNAEQVRGVAGCGEVVVVRKQPLPLLRLGQILNIPAEITDPSLGLVVIVEHEERQMALLIDEVMGQQQVVVKSLETNFKKVQGIGGATILGDGRAALILDIAGIVAMSRIGGPSCVAA
jgi:two-component system chemotaxis sensor kinase CheA